MISEKPQAPIQTPPPQTSIEDVLFLLSKWKWSILGIVTLALFMAGFWVFAVSDDYYTPEAKLLVKPGLEQSAPPTVTDRQIATTVGYRSADVKSEVDVLESSDLLNILVEKYKLDQPQPQAPPKGLLKTIRYHLKSLVTGVREKMEDLYIAVGLRERLTPREKAIEGLRRGLSVKATEGSNSIVADLSLPFRKGSGAVLNALLDEYMKFRVALYRNRGDEYFQEEMERRAEDLTAAEKDENAFERQTDLTNQQQQTNLLLQQVADLEVARHEAQVEYSVAQAKYEQIRTESAKAQPNYGSVGDFDSSPFQRNLMSEIAGLEKRRQELLLTEMESNDKVQNVDQQLRILTDMLKANVESVRNDKKLKWESAEAEHAKVQARLREIHAAEVRWTDLQRKTQSLETEYDLFRKRYNESAATRAAMERQVDENVVVLEHATDPLQPSGVRKTTFLGLAFIAGLIVALAYVVAREWMDQRVYTPGQVERFTGAPVLALVPIQPDQDAGKASASGTEGRL